MGKAYYLDQVSHWTSTCLKPDIFGGLNDHLFSEWSFVLEVFPPTGMDHLGSVTENQIDHMAATISQASISDSHSKGSHGPPFPPDRSQQSHGSIQNSSSNQSRESLPVTDSHQARHLVEDGSTGVIMDSSVAVPRPLTSSTVEEDLRGCSTPPLTTTQPADTTGDVSRYATDRQSPSSSSSCTSYFSSISCEDFFDTRNRRFPPVLPSTIQRGSSSQGASFVSRLASILNGSAAANHSANNADSLTNVSPSTDEEDDSKEGSDATDQEQEGQQEDDDTSDDLEGSVEQQNDDEDRHVQDLWMKLQDQRDAVRQLRLELSDRRKRLRDLRTKKDSADNSFMGMVRAHLVSGNLAPSSRNVLIRQFDVLQKARDDYQDEERDVEQLETRLDQEELYRETLETQFYTVIYGAPHGRGHEQASLSGSVTESDAPPSRTSLLGIPAERPVDIHPLYKQLLHAVGDRELAKEYYADLVGYRDLILYDLQLKIKRERLRDAEGDPGKRGAIPGSDDIFTVEAIIGDPERMDRIRAKYKKIISSDNWQFLHDFPTKEATLREKVTETESRVDRLRQICIDKGFMRKHLPYHEEYTIFSETNKAFSFENISITSGEAPRQREDLASPRFPILLSNPSHVLKLETPMTALKGATRLPSDDQTKPHRVAEAMKEFGISTLLMQTEAENKSDFINRWLLQRLRISPLEAELLYAIFSSFLKVRNIRRWQEDVLYHWSRDGANRPKEVFDGLLTMKDALTIDEDIGSEVVDIAVDSWERPSVD